MAERLRLTRPELRRQRDVLDRLKRALPLLELRRRQLQEGFQRLSRELAAAESDLSAAQELLSAHAPLFSDHAGTDVSALSTPTVVLEDAHLAGLAVQQIASIDFPEATPCRFFTPPWVDSAILAGRRTAEAKTRRDVIAEQRATVEAALRRLQQRVNLFEQVLIPDAERAIKRIGVRLADESTAAIGRAKIAKQKILAASEPAGLGPADGPSRQSPGRAFAGDAGAKP